MTAPADPRRRTAACPCRGTVRTPGEKSISHRAVLFARAGRGDLGGPRALRRRRRGGLAGRGRGDGRRGRAPRTTARRRCTAAAAGCTARRPLDCGNSGTSMRLLAGLVAGFAWETELVGDESLSAAPDGPGGRAARAHGGDRRGSGRAVPAAAARPGRRAARHRLDVEGGQRAGEVGHPAGRPVGRGHHRRARGGDHPRPTPRRCWPRPGVDITVEPWGEGRDRHRARLGAAPVDAHVPGRPVGRRPSSSWPGASSRAARSRWPDVYQRPGPAGLRRGPPAHGRATVTLRLRDRDGTATIAATRTRPAPLQATDGRRRPRSPRSTRSPPWPWPRPWPRARRSSPTWASCGSRRSTGWPRWPRWSRPSAPRPRSTATRWPITGVAAARCAAPASTAGATTAWPWPPRSPRWPPRPGERSLDHRVRRGGDQLPRVRRRPRAGSPADRASRHRGPCSSPSTGRPGAGQVHASRARWPRDLGLDRLDTGAMYRAVAALALARGIAPDDARRRGRAGGRAPTIEVGPAR